MCWQVWFLRLPPCYWAFRAVLLGCGFLHLVLPADFVTCWQLSSARSFGNVFFPVWFGRLYWLGPMGILLVPACQLFPFLCKVFGSTLFHTRSLDCTAYFCCQFSVFTGYVLLLSLVAVWVLVCIRRPAGPAVLAVLSSALVTCFSRSSSPTLSVTCPSALGRFPSFASRWGVPWFLAYVCGSFWVFSAHSFHASALGFRVGSLSGGLLSLPAPVGRPSFWARQVSFVLLHVLP